MTMMPRKELLSLALVALAAVGACSSTEKEADKSPRIAPLSAEEITRAKKACTAYAERVCACAATNPDLTQTCELAKASPGALQINLDLLASEGLKLGEQKAVKVEARKIAAVCFQADSKLDVGICPREIP